MLGPYDEEDLIIIIIIIIIISIIVDYCRCVASSDEELLGSDF